MPSNASGEIHFVVVVVVYVVSELGTPSRSSWDITPSSVARQGGGDWDMPSPALSKDSGIGTK